MQSHQFGILIVNLPGMRNLLIVILALPLVGFSQPKQAKLLTQQAQLWDTTYTTSFNCFKQNPKAEAAFLEEVLQHISYPPMPLEAGIQDKFVVRVLFGDSGNVKSITPYGNTTAKYFYQAFPKMTEVLPKQYLSNATKGNKGCSCELLYPIKFVLSKNNTTQNYLKDGWIIVEATMPAIIIDTQK